MLFFVNASGLLISAIKTRPNDLVSNFLQWRGCLMLYFLYESPITCYFFFFLMLNMSLICPTETNLGNLVFPSLHYLLFPSLPRFNQLLLYLLYDSPVTCYFCQWWICDVSVLLKHARMILFFLPFVLTPSPSLPPHSRAAVSSPPFTPRTKVLILFCQAEPLVIWVLFLVFHRLWKRCIRTEGGSDST